MRGSELYRRYLDKISAIAVGGETPPDWERRVEYVVKEFHSETMPMARVPFRSLRDDIASDLEGKAGSYATGRARVVFSLAARLIRTL
jgi:hypothetical protein